MVQEPKIRPEDFIYLHSCIGHTASGGTDIDALCHCKQHERKGKHPYGEPACPDIREDESDAGYLYKSCISDICG